MQDINVYDETAEFHGKMAWPERLKSAVGKAEIEKAQSPSTKMLLAIQAKGKHMYEGTVPAAVKAHRRAKNKRARAARRIGR